ncbi:MAG: 50S ribosomal protein L3 N(5)-glutamine methyltransferase, partial [Betaproteobacteria bacterium]
MIDHVAHELAAARLHYGHGTDNPRDEAAWLVGNALQISPQDLAKHLRDRPNATEIEGIRALVEERIQTRKPLAYLLNEAWFAGRRFYVDERVLVPRSLTAEFIAERFQPWIAPHAVRRALDLCTGSGCIAIALAHAFPGARVDATDLSTDALAVARINIERHGLHDRVRLIHADLFKGIPRKRYDLIVTNPPYVGAREMRTLPREYRHEPAAGVDPCDGEHHAGQVGEILIGEGKPAERIAGARIKARRDEHELRLEAIHGGEERLPEGAEDLFPSRAGRQGFVERRPLP